MPSHSIQPRKAVIIGSGIGGLSTGIILSKLGFDVTVVEKNRKPGGMMRSYTRQGVECEVGVHYVGSLGEGQILYKFFDYLGVRNDIPAQRMGENGVIDRYFFDSNTTRPETFDFPEGLEAYEHNLRQAFPDQGSQITEVLQPLKKMSRQLHALDLLYSEEIDFSLFDQSQPLGRILNRLQCAPGLRSVLEVPSKWIGVPLDDCPAYYHNMALASYLSSSWRLKCSGSHMADVFAGRLKSLGGRIITGEAVSEILVDGRTVAGIGLESGDRLYAPIVVGAVHPRVVLHMLPQGAVRPSYRKRITNLQNTGGIFGVHAGLNSDEHPAIPYNIIKLDTDSTGKVSDLLYFQIRRSAKPGVSTLTVLTSGKEDLWQPWEGTLSGHRGDAYLSLKQKESQGLIQEAEAFFGPLKGLNILDAYTPLTIRDWVNSPDGSAYGVMRSASQSLAAALLNRTSVKGLYLAGQSVLAPGIIGTLMGSFATVKLIIGAKAFRQQVRMR